MSNDTDRRYTEQLQAEGASHRKAAEELGGQIASLEQRRREHEETADAAEQLLRHIETRGKP
jgi:hypothetical protein